MTSIPYSRVSGEATPGVSLSMAISISISPVRCRKGRAKLKSPGVALFSVGSTLPCLMRSRRGAVPVQQVAEALYQHPPAEKIGELGEIFPVGNRLVERAG